MSLGRIVKRYYVVIHADFNSSPSVFEGQCIVARWRYGTVGAAGAATWESIR
jgi:hypothetical protein